MSDVTRVVGSFADRQHATAAVHALRAAGFHDSHIGVLARDTRTGLPNDPTGTRWEEGAEIGAAAGAVTGLTLGLATAAGILAPPLGPVVVGGTLLALLGNTAGCAALGAVAGGVVGLGFPEGEQAYYKDEIDAGRALVVVDTDRADDARAVLISQGGSLRAPADTVTS